MKHLNRALERLVRAIVREITAEVRRQIDAAIVERDRQLARKTPDEGANYHNTLNQRRRLRERGVPDEDLPPIPKLSEAASRWISVTRRARRVERMALQPGRYVQLEIVADAP